MKLVGRFFATICLTVIAVAPAVAHTTLVYSVPGRYQIVATFPNEITLSFGEDLLTIDEKVINSFKVISSSGNSVKLSPPRIQGATISASLNDSAPDFGIYTVSYRIVAGDGHVVQGSYNFRYQSENLGDDPAEGQSEEGAPSANENVTDSQSFLNQYGAVTSAVGLPLLLIFSWILFRSRKNS